MSSFLFTLFQLCYILIAGCHYTSKGSVQNNCITIPNMPEIGLDQMVLGSSYLYDDNLFSWKDCLYIKLVLDISIPAMNISYSISRPGETITGLCIHFGSTCTFSPDNFGTWGSAARFTKSGIIYTPQLFTQATATFTKHLVRLAFLYQGTFTNWQDGTLSIYWYNINCLHDFYPICAIYFIAAVAVVLCWHRAIFRCHLPLVLWAGIRPMVGGSNTGKKSRKNYGTLDIFRYFFYPFSTKMLMLYCSNDMLIGNKNSQVDFTTWKIYVSVVMWRKNITCLCNFCVLCGRWRWYMIVRNNMCFIVGPHFFQKIFYSVAIFLKSKHSIAHPRGSTMIKRSTAWHYF